MLFIVFLLLIVTDDFLCNVLFNEESAEVQQIELYRIKGIRAAKLAAPFELYLTVCILCM